MQFIPHSIPGIVEVVPKRHRDHRGYFSEVFKNNLFRQEVSDVDFVQENESLSESAGTIRGLHFQTNPFAQGKLVRCLRGSLFDVAVDIRTGSPTYGKWTSAVLSEENGHQLWIPSGFAHGFCTLMPKTTICYKVTSVYSPECDAGVAWDDSTIAVDWPDIVDAESLSAKDKIQPKLSGLPVYFSY